MQCAGDDTRVVALAACHQHSVGGWPSSTGAHHHQQRSGSVSAEGRDAIFSIEVLDVGTSVQASTESASSSGQHQRHRRRGGTERTSPPNVGLSDSGTYSSRGSNRAIPVYSAPASCDADACPRNAERCKRSTCGGGSSRRRAKSPRAFPSPDGLAATSRGSTRYSNCHQRSQPEQLIDRAAAPLVSHFHIPFKREITGYGRNWSGHIHRIEYAHDHQLPLEIRPNLR